MDSLGKFQTSIDDLPIEIIVEIFRYLNFGDLQSVALTCHRWLEASQAGEFTEKIVVYLTPRNIYKLNREYPLSSEYSPVRIFLNSKRSFSNVCIEHNTFKTPRELFKHMGRSVVAATLVDDDISYERFLEVLQDLRNLRTLKISGLFRKSMIFYNENFLESPTDRNNIADTMANIRKLSIRSIYFSDANILRLTSLILNLEFLDLRGCTIITDSEPFMMLNSELNLTFESICGIIAKHQVTLHELKLSNMSFDKDRMSALCQLKYLKLRTLCLGRIRHVDAIDFRTFLQTQTNLRHLDLSYSDFVTDECVEIIVEKLKSLEILNLEYCFQITNSGMGAIAKLRKLQSLNISDCYRITSEGIIKGIASVTNNVLQQLNVSFMDLSEECVKLLAQHLPELRVLDLGNCKNGVTDNSVQAIIQNLKWLRELNLESCFKITDAALTGLNGGSSIQELKGLRTLKLNQCKISDIPLICSFKFVELRRLYLCHCKEILDTSILALVQNCPSLELLDLFGCSKINDYTVKAVLSQSKRLKKRLVILM